MKQLSPVLFVTFLESVGTGLLQRGLYFYTHERLDFGEVDNLLTALGYGVVYVAGALESHRLTARFGEKQLLSWTLLGLLGVHAGLALFPRSALLLIAGFLAVALLQGVKWPIVESYASAGLTPGELLKALGRYNVSWALAMPVAVGASGALIGTWPQLLFSVPAAINVVSLFALRALPSRPVHLDRAHPARPNRNERRRLSALLASARWSMLGSYALLFLLAPLLPEIFRRLSVGVEHATLAASVIDLVRLSTFMALGAFGAAWRGRVWPLAAVIGLLPVSFSMVLFGPSLAVVLVGEALFGAAAGFAYTAALYYALVVKNASVDAGGAHEGLIGLGFGIGPLAGIAGHWLAGTTLPGLAPSVGYVESMLLAVSPLVVACTIGAMWPIRRG